MLKLVYVSPEVIHQEAKLRMSMKRYWQYEMPGDRGPTRGRRYNSAAALARFQRWLDNNRKKA
jgi:hypothetical protein